MANDFIWCKLDVSMYKNVKLERLGDMEAVGFAYWVAAIMYCRERVLDNELPDGYITRKRFERLFLQPCPEGLVENLISIGTLVEDGSNLYVKGFETYQQTSQEIAEISAIRAENGKKGARTRWQTYGKPMAKPKQNPSKTLAELELELERDKDINIFISNDERFEIELEQGKLSDQLKALSPAIFKAISENTSIPENEPPLAIARWVMDKYSVAHNKNAAIAWVKGNVYERPEEKRRIIQPEPPLCHCGQMVDSNGCWIDNPNGSIKNVIERLYGFRVRSQIPLTYTLPYCMNDNCEDFGKLVNYE